MDKRAIGTYEALNVDVRPHKFFPLWMKGGRYVGSCESPHVGVKFHKFLALSWTRAMDG
jgi:hypothetical protein